MANAIYDKFKEALLDALANTDLNDGDVRVILVDAADYVFSQAHDFLDDVPVAARVATSGTMTNTTVVNGVFDADGEGMHPLVCVQNEGFVLRNGAVAFPAAMTWTFAVNVVWAEAAAF